jgi:hypothetical protein
VTDAGLKHLAGLKGLRELELRSASHVVKAGQITEAAVAQLQQALPNCKIRRK